MGDTVDVTSRVLAIRIRRDDDGISVQGLNIAEGSTEGLPLPHVFRMV